ncbi:ABC transporter permease subunit [Bacillus sp. REN10]|uniref:ABC transporter permease subunit n=1 Tax=Bacillus sp. REN10 TaxID=2782541 RepID=UPI00193C80A6|nr:ABC transporter permease subunit [Bacillus sp. REN10]
MNGALYQKMMKVHAKAMFSYGMGAALYLLLVISVYPSVSGTEMDQLLQQMPQGFIDAFNLDQGMGTLLDFISGKFYGLLFVIILTIYCIMTASQLLARLVDRGAIAYLLSMPVARDAIARTQLLVLLSGLVIIIGCTMLGGIIGAFLFIDESFALGNFVKLNLIALLFFYVISGIAFLFSAIMNDEKKALAYSASLILLFYVLDLAAKISDQLDWLQYMTIFTVFNPAKIIKPDYAFGWIMLGLGLAGTILFAVAIRIFTKKDLSV